MKTAHFYLILKSAAIFYILVSTLCLVVSAHTGGTDANGGHYDRSTGEYHYHHGYSAHQHINGQCPYDFVDKSGQNSGTSGTSKNQITSYKSQVASKSQVNTPSKEASRTNMEKTLLYLGISVVLYYISSWLHYFYLRLEDQNKHPFIQNLCFWCAFIIGAASVPVTLAFIFLNSKKADRLTKISEKEGFDKGYRAGCGKEPDMLASYELVSRYAARMQMTIPQYLNWVKEQERLRAQK